MPPDRSDQRPDSTPPKGDRIAKLLARAGIASRREIERMIAEGRIARDGVTIDTPATVLRSLHGITVDGQPVAAPPPARLFLYHKPVGLLVTEHDPAGRPTIYDRLPADLPRVLPVGRLDLNTEGLLLLTTDGGLKRTLELPATGVERAYRARAYGTVSQTQLEDLIEGVEIDGIRYGKIDANLERRTGANVWIEMILTEGKNREVRRVLEHLGLQVGRLIRTRYGPFVLGDLQPGEVGEVRQHDLVAFRKALAGKHADGGERIAVEARVAAPIQPETPTTSAETPRPRAAAAPKRPEKSTAGWGSRTRPSRPAAPAAPAVDRRSFAVDAAPLRSAAEEDDRRDRRGAGRDRSAAPRPARGTHTPSAVDDRSGRRPAPRSRPDGDRPDRGGYDPRSSRPPGTGSRLRRDGAASRETPREDRYERSSHDEGTTRTLRRDGRAPARGDRDAGRSGEGGKPARTPAARPPRGDRPDRPDAPRPPRGGAKSGGGFRPNGVPQRGGGNGGGRPKPGGARPPRGRR